MKDYFEEYFKRENERLNEIIKKTAPQSLMTMR